MSEVGFPTHLAARLARVTPKVLENWTFRGVLTPSISAGTTGKHHPRVYSFRDLVAIRVLATLREAGIDLRGLRRVVEHLRERKGLSATEALSTTCLITDGHDVFELDGSVPISALRRPGQGVLHVVPLDVIVSELQREARAVQSAA